MLPQLIRHAPAALLITLVLTASGWLSVTPAALGATSAGSVQTPDSASPSPSTSITLQDRKLEQEVRKLETENVRAGDPWHQLLSLAPSLAALAAIATVAVSWSKQREDTRRQRDADREQRQTESRRQFDASFADVVANLGSGSASLQASAAATLAIFLDDNYAEFYGHTVRVIIANLKMDHSPAVRKLLLGVLSRALTKDGSSWAASSLTNLDLELADADLQGLSVPLVRFPDGMVLSGANLSGATLDGATMWKADFCGATLKKTSARRANVGQAKCDDAVLVGARFDGASITSTSLRRVDAKYASFKGARLQSAHFDRADLRGARFEGANLTDTYFFGARLDQGALQSILRTPYWRHAHFDGDVFDRLRVLSESAVAVPD